MENVARTDGVSSSSIDNSMSSMLENQKNYKQLFKQHVKQYAKRNCKKVIVLHSSNQQSLLLKVLNNLNFVNYSHQKIVAIQSLVKKEKSEEIMDVFILAKKKESPTLKSIVKKDVTEVFNHFSFYMIVLE